MIKTFIFGIILGVAGVLAALHFVPVVDQYREASIISVTPNGGNAESFHVKVPTDRIMSGAQGQARALPKDMDWPQDPLFGNVQAEMFKLRNSRDAVVGIAGRVASKDPQFGDMIEWVLHLPARGSLVAKMHVQTADGGLRSGTINSGTREFGSLQGQFSERWISEGADSQSSRTGRIELELNFVGTERYDSESELEVL